MESPFASRNSTTAVPCGKCWRCGGTLYEYLVHHCTTNVQINPKPDGGLGGTFRG